MRPDLFDRQLDIFERNARVESHEIFRFLTLGSTEEAYALRH